MKRMVWNNKEKDNNGIFLPRFIHRLKWNQKVINFLFVFTNLVPFISFLCFSFYLADCFNEMNFECEWKAIMKVGMRWLWPSLLNYFNEFSKAHKLSADIFFLSPSHPLSWFVWNCFFSCNVFNSQRISMEFWAWAQETLDRAMIQQNGWKREPM